MKGYIILANGKLFGDKVYREAYDASQVIIKQCGYHPAYGTGTIMDEGGKKDGVHYTMKQINLL